MSHVIQGRRRPPAALRGSPSEGRRRGGALPPSLTSRTPCTRRQIAPAVMALALLAALAAPGIAHAQVGPPAAFARRPVEPLVVSADPTTIANPADRPRLTAAREGGPEDPPAPLAPEHRAELARLIEKATQAGTVNVIVGLTLPGGYTPEWRLGERGAVERQRAAIAQARTALLASLRTARATAYASVDTLPFLALTVDAAALRLMAEAPLITSIQEDGLSRTQ